jgi:hypothetical protein
MVYKFVPVMQQKKIKDLLSNGKQIFAFILSACPYCYEIDDVKYSKPCYIKFDVEWAEINAHLGSMSIITKFKTSLSVSNYDCPHHWCEIPTLIKE